MSTFDSLFGYERTRRTFQGLIHGIVAGEFARSCDYAFFPEMAAVLRGERSVRRIAEGKALSEPAERRQRNHILRKQGVQLAR